MEQSFLKQMSGFLRDKKNHKRYIAVFLCLALVVSLTTFVSLTMSGNAQNHMVKVLDCKYEAHKHTADCYDKEHPDQLICGYADYAVHIHNDDCYDASGVLVCQLPQIEPHTHDETCYTEAKTLTCELPESEGHVHTEACYTTEQGELTCTVEEHTHSEECYDENGEVICGKEEHTHNEACYEQIQTLTCEIPEGEGAHTHTDDCYVTEKKLTCGKLELHTHTEECYQHDENGKLVLANDAELVLDDEGNPVFDEEHQPIVICGIPVLEEHVHGADCFKTVELTDEEVDGFDTPETSQAPAESESCYDAEGNLTCTKEEHTHTEECYDEAAAEIVCGKEEHTHHTAPAEAPAEAESCYDAEGNLICTKEEHTHSEECYGEDGALICEKEEHTHTAPAPAEAESCYDAEGNLTCTKEEHTHSEECYGEDGALTCEKEEHTHTGAGESNEPEELTKTYQDSGVVITATYTEAANIPEEAELIAKAVTSETDPELYAQRMEEALQHVTLPEDAETPNMLLYNIGFYVDGEEVEPAAPVTITVQLLNAEGFAVGAPITVVHFADDGTEVLDGTALNENSETTFTTDGFSDIMLVAWVDGTVEGAGSGTFEKFIDDVTYSGATYDPLKDEWFSHFHMDFTISQTAFEKGTREFDYVFPDDVYVPSDSLLENQKGKYRDKQDRFSFWFEVDKDGKTHMHIEFDDEDVQRMGDSFDCYMEFDAKGGTVEGDGSIDIPFKDNAHLEIPDDAISKPYDLSTNKYGSVNYQNGKITYTVYVESKYGTEGDITLKDQPDINKLPVLRGPTNVKVERETLDESWTVKKTEEVTNLSPTINEETGNLQMTLPQLKTEEGLWQRYKVTYEYTLPEIEDQDVHIVGNTVTVEDGSHHDEKTSQVTVQKKRLTKTGSVVVDDDGNKYIEWTIVVNEAQSDIAGMTLTDTLFDQLTPDSNFSIQPPSNVVIVGSDGKEYAPGDTLPDDVTIKSLEFEPDNGTNTTKYTITYRTPVPEGWNEDSASVKNEATLKDPDGKPKYEDKQEVKPGLPGPAPKPETEKKALGDTEAAGGRNVKWSISIKVPDDGLKKGTELVDNIGWSSGTIYMTRDQFLDLIQAIKNSGLADYIDVITFKCFGNWDGVHGEGAEEIEYNLETGTVAEGSHQLTDRCHITKFSFKLNEDAPKDKLYLDGDGNLTFEYETFVPNPTDNTGSQEFVNVFNDDQVKYTLYYDSVDKSDGDGNSNTTIEDFNKEEGLITWRIRVTVGQDHESITITDNAQAGLILKSVKYEVQPKDGTGFTGEDTNPTDGLSFNRDGVTGTFTDGQTEITVTNADDLKPGTVIDVYLTFKLPDEDLAQLKEPDVVKFKQYKNSAEVMFGTMPKQDEDQITIPGTKKEDEFKGTVTKSGEYDETNKRFKYSVAINPDGLDLNYKGDVVSFTDQLRYEITKTTGVYYACTIEDIKGKTIFYDQYFELHRGSVQLYYAKKNDYGDLVRDDNGNLMAGEPVPSEFWSWQYTETTEFSLGGNENWAGAWKDYRISLITAQIPDRTPLVLVYEYEPQLSNWRVSSELYVYSVIKNDPNNPIKSETTPYDYDVLEEGQAFDQWNGPKVGADNTATVMGSISDSHKVDHTWETSSVSAGSSTQGYTLHKVSSLHANENLPGAKFTLYKMGEGGTLPGPPVDGADFFTDTNGEITLSVKTATDGSTTTYTLVVKDSKEEHSITIEPNTLYYLQETAAPDDYLKPADPVKSWIWYGDGTKTLNDLDVHELIEEGENVYDLSRNDTNQVYITNEPNPNPGYTLPETGGGSTHMYMLGGAMLLLLAAALAYKAKISGRRVFRG